MGGEKEKHTLTSDEMPSHNHPIRRTSSNSGDGNFIDVKATGSPNNMGTGTGTKAAGKGKAHNNMPPYIALFFCVKR